MQISFRTVQIALPAAILAGSSVPALPDGNLWYTQFGGTRIGRITPAGVVTEFVTPTAGSGPYNIAVGPDGNLWFTEYTTNKIGRVTP